MTSKRVTEDERARIEAAVRGGMTRNDAARNFERSPSTISKIARDAGLSFDRTATKAATEAKQADNAARRSKLVEQLLTDAERLQAQMFAPTVAFNFGGRDNTYEEHHIDEPTFQDKRHIAGAVRMMITTAIDAERVDQGDTGHGALEQLTEAIRRARTAAAG